MTDKPTRKPTPARPAYMIYRITDNAELDVIATVRKAEDALELVDNNEGAMYKRFTLK